MIGVASTAPGYSLAASLGFVVAVVGIGLQAPAILLVAFVPMLLIAAAYYYLNRADPDCGTTFSWVTQAMGPWAGWIGGWAIIVADIIVMANLAQIAGLYTFLLFGWQSAADSTFGGHRRRRRVDRRHDGDLRPSASSCRRARRSALLGVEIVTLALFAVVALVKVAAGDAGPDSVDPSSAWFNPFAIDSFERADQRGADRDLHLLGLGQHGDRQRGDRGLDETPGQGGAVVATVHPAR